MTGTHNNGMHPTPRHRVSHESCVGARVMPGVRWQQSDILPQMGAAGEILEVSLFLLEPDRHDRFWMSDRVP